MKPCENSNTTLSAEAVPGPAGQAGFCGRCGARIPDDRPFCLVCGGENGAPPRYLPEASLESTQELPAWKVPVGAAARQINMRLMAAVVAVCVLLTFSAAGIWLVQTLPYLTANAGKRAQGALLYISENRLLMRTSSQRTEELDGNLRVDLSAVEHPSSLASISRNGRYIAYLNDVTASGGGASGGLYVLDLGKAPTPDSPHLQRTLLEQNCTDTFFFMGGRLVFLTAGGELCGYDFLNREIIATGVNTVFEHSDSGVLFAGGSGGAYDVALAIAGESGFQKFTVGNGIQELCDWNDSFSRFVYTKQTTAGLSLFTFDRTKNSILQIAESIDAVVDADADTGEVLFQKTQPFEFRYDDLINDDMFSQDVSMREPSVEDYPLLSNYMGIHGEEPDSADNSANEELLQEYDRFVTDAEAYEAKQARDALRTQIRLDVAAFVERFPSAYELYLCRDGVVSRVSEWSLRPFKGVSLESDAKTVIWSEMGMRSLRKIRISAYEDTVQMPLGEYLDGLMTETLFVQMESFPSLRMYVGEGRHFVTGWQLDTKKSGLYFAMGDGSPLADIALNSANLYWAPLSGGTATGVVLVDEEIGTVTDLLPDGRLLYSREQAGGLCDLYAYNGSQHERIGGDIYLNEQLFQLLNNGKTLLFCEHFGGGAGDLQMLGGQTRLVATDVSGFYYRNDGLVYMLRAKSGNTAELWAFGDSGLVKINDSVTAVLE